MHVILTHKYCNTVIYIFIFQIHLKTMEHVICKKAFCSLYGIKKARVERLSSYVANNIGSPPDKRGKHNNRPNRVSANDTENVIHHIQQFPAQTSHYSRKDNIKKVFLSSELNVKKMYELYLEQYEPEAFKNLTTGRKVKNCRITYDYYYRYFTTNFNISFGRPKSDTCEKCDSLNKLIAECTDNPEQKRIYETEKNVHLNKSEVFYERLRDEVKRAKENRNVACLAFDFQQNMPLPMLPSTDVFYSRQVWMYNFNIHCFSNGKAHMFMYTECDGKKGPDEVVSCLDWYIKNVLSPETTELVLFSDNCASQNKNKTLIRYLFSLTYSNRFQKITHNFPERGHSFLPCDRDFGNIEKKKRLITRLHSPEEWHSLVKKSSKLFTVVPVKQSMFKSYGAHFKPLFKGNMKTRKNEPFKISQYKVFQYSSHHKYILKVSQNQQATVISDFSPLKKTSNGDLGFPDKLLYNGPLPIKKGKYEDVMKLARKYIASADMGFYEKLYHCQGSANEVSERSSEHSE